jgi:AcrR family transcriptional regulator
MGRPPREDRPPEILEATCRAIARVGIGGLYIRHVAEEAGVSRALVSYYFPTKAELLSAALEYAETRAIEEIDSRTLGGPAPERITETLLLEIDDSPAVRDNWIIWNEITGAALFDPSFEGALETWSAKWNSKLAQLIREGQGAHTVPVDVDAEAAAERLTGLVDGIGVRWLLGLISRERAHELLRGAVLTELHL